MANVLISGGFHNSSPLPLSLSSLFHIFCHKETISVMNWYSVNYSKKPTLGCLIVKMPPDRADFSLPREISWGIKKERRGRKQDLKGV